MSKIEVGQKIFVNKINHFFQTEPNLHEHFVMKINTRSFYTCFTEDANKEKPFLYRFDKKTMKHRNSFDASTWYAYLTEEEYWNKIERAKKRVALIEMLKLEIDQLSLEQLIEVEKLIVEMRKESRRRA